MEKSETFQSIPLKGVVEKPMPEKVPSNLAVLGLYILPAKIMNLLENTQIGVGGEIQLTDALDELLKNDELNAIETDAAVYDCSNKQGFLLANIAMGMRDTKTKNMLNHIFRIK